MVAETKHKANPATDEVCVENWNHGLAWSAEHKVAIKKQSKVCYACSKAITKEKLRAPVKRLTLSLEKH